MQPILVTGASGQLGYALKQHAPAFPQFGFTYTDYEELDITNADAVSTFIAQLKPALVVNCAAYTAVDKAESEIEKAQQLNAGAVENLSNACRKVASYLIHISTDYVFDGKNHRPYVEDDATLPASVYGQTKLKGEQAALSYNKSLVIRTSWLYSTVGNNFVKTMLRLGAERSDLGVVFDQVGSPTNAADLAHAILCIAEKILANPTSFSWGVYHYSNEGVCSWYDFALKIMQLGKRSCKLRPIETKDYPTPAKRPFYSVMNKAKVKATYGIEIPHWEESLARCIEILEK